MHGSINQDWNYECQKWEELTTVGSIANGRPMVWPEPYVLKGKDKVQLANEHMKFGYVSDLGDRPVPLEPHFDWSANPFQSRPWRIRVMCLQPMDVFLYAYQKSGEFHYLQKALNLLFDYIDQMIISEGRGYMDWADMAVGYRAIKLSYIIDLALKGEWVPSDREKWMLIRASEEHLRELTIPENISRGNHGIFQMHGLCILSRVYWASERSDESFRFSQEWMSKLVLQQFNSEGLHLEHSPQYHWWMAEEMRNLGASGWHNSIEISDRLLRSEEVKNWLLSPGNTFYPFGDTTKAVKMKRPMTSPEPDFSTDLYQVRIFKEGGYLFVISDEESFVQTAAYHSKAHKHADDLHIEWHAFGGAVLTDAGSTGYKMDESRKYILSTRAHNTVQFNARNYPRDGTDKYGSALMSVECFAEAIRVRSKVDHKSLDFVHERVVTYAPGIGVHLRDRMTARRRATFTQWFHFAPEWEAQIGAGQVRVAHGDASVLVASDCGPPAKVCYGDTEPELNGWRAVSAKLTPSCSIGYQKAGKEEEIRTFVYRSDCMVDEEVFASFTNSDKCVWSWQR